MPDELKNMHYNPTVEQMTWAALGNYDFAAGVDRCDFCRPGVGPGAFRPAETYCALI